MRTFGLSLLFISLVTALAAVAVPLELAHQGRLVDADGNPASGSFEITYRLFDVASGGNPLWEETQLVTVQDGLFDVRLGSSVPVDLNALGIRPDSLWLEIQVGAELPLTPRTQLAATPLASVSSSVNGDIKTEEGRVRIDLLDTDDDNDGVDMLDTPDSSGFSIKEVDGLGNANVLYGTTYFPGQDIFAQILFEHVRTGEDPDTSYHLRDKAQVTDEKFHVTETFGPSPATRESTQGADTGSAYIVATAFDGFDSSHTVARAKADGAILKTFFETGDKPVESQLGSHSDTAYMQLQHPTAGGTITLRSQDDGVISDMIWVQTDGPFRYLTQGASDTGLHHSLSWDTEDDLAPQQTSIVDDNISKILLKAAAERAFDAVISVGPKDPSFPNDSIRGTMAFQSISTDLLDTTDVFTLETAAEGALIRMVDQNNDTAITLDGGGGGGGRIVVEAEDVNGLGESVKNRFTLSSSSVVGKGFVLDGSQSMDDRGGIVMTPDSLAFVDSSGATTAALKKGDKISLVGFGTLSADNPRDTSFAVDTVGNAYFAGSMRVGPTDPFATLSVGGDICATGAIGACSDARYKTDVTTISNALDRITQLRGVAYRWKQDEYPDHAFDDKRHVGFIAQEVEMLFPELVMTDDKGYKSVDYSRVTPLLVQAVKEQQARIDDQQAQIDELKAMVRQLVQDNKRGNEEYGLK